MEEAEEAEEEEEEEEEQEQQQEQEEKNNHNKIITTTTAAKGAPPCPALPAEALATKCAFKKCSEHIESISWKHLKTACARSHWILWIFCQGTGKG